MIPIFCICLRQSPERTRLAQQHFRERGLDVTLFHGIHAPTMGLVTTKKADPRKDDYIMQPGQVGCLLSHYVLWQMLAFMPHKEILIVEDDAVFCQHFKERFEAACRFLPSDWQFCYVGHCNTNRGMDHVQPTKYEAGTHAYLVKREALEILLATNQEMRTHCDIQIGQNSLPKLCSYRMMPSLVEQRTQRKSASGSYEWQTTTNNLALTEPYPTGEITMPSDPSTDVLVLKVLKGILPTLGGWLEELEAIHIIETILREKPSLCVEIGVFQGKGLFTMGAALKQIGAGQAFGIDPWNQEATLEDTPDGPNKEWWKTIDHEHFYATTMERCGQFGLSDFCTVVRAKSTDKAALDLFTDGSVNLIRFDGNHNVQPYLNDVTAWLPKLASGCWIYFNDVGWTDGGCTDTTEKARNYLLANGCVSEMTRAADGRMVPMMLKSTVILRKS